MKKYLVIGNPIDHSLSPKLHNYWIKKNNIDAIYEKRLVEEKDLKNLCDEVREGKIQGFNVTVPFKEKINKYLDGFTESASKTRAVNTVYRKLEGEECIIMGDNTDVYGFQKSCSLSYVSRRGAKALIIGAGGASKAVICALDNIGIKKFAIINRTKEKAQKLIEDLKIQKADIYEWCKDEARLSKPDIVVNCTSLGLKSGDTIPLEFLKYKKKFFTKKIIFFDLIYNPSETNFLKTAKEIGQLSINGKMMFIYQAQKSFEKWHNILPEVNDEVINLLND